MEGWWYGSYCRSLWASSSLYGMILLDSGGYCSGWIEHIGDGMQPHSLAGSTVKDPGPYRVVGDGWLAALPDWSARVLQDKSRSGGDKGMSTKLPIRSHPIAAYPLSYSPRKSKSVR